MDHRIDAILTAWFGTPDESPEAVAKRWFVRDPGFDESLRARLGDDHAAAGRGELDAWAVTARGALALVILLDQLSRNLYRDDPRAFANDAHALAIARAALAGGLDRELDWNQRVFLVMPLMHDESAAVQAEAVAQFAGLAEAAAQAGASAEQRKQLVNTLDFAERHAAIVHRFGRFPHRNAALGRVSTAEEAEFLQQPGSSF